MPKVDERPVETIAIRNPRICELVAAEQAGGAGRSATEAAENLILDGVELRRMKRDPGATGSRSPRRRKSVSV